MVVTKPQSENVHIEDKIDYWQDWGLALAANQFCLQ